MVTLKRIAEVAGVSVATVSMALRNNRRISQRRRDQILKVATELGWTQNAQVSALMRHVRRAQKVSERETLALVMAHPKKDARHSYEFIDRIFNGIEHRAHELGYRTKTFWYNDPEMPPARLCNILESRGMRGVALLPFRQFDIIEFDWDSFCVARIGGMLNHPPVHHVVDDHFNNMLLALSHLWASGYRRISLSWPSHMVQGAYFMMTSAYEKFMRDFSSKAVGKTQNFIHPDWSKETFLHWVKTYRPEAVVTYRWDIYEWLSEAGYNVPDEIGIALLNYSPSQTRLAGVDSLPECMGAIAIDLLVEQLENNVTGLPLHPKIITTPGIWSDGGSVRPATGPLPVHEDILSYRSR